MRKTLLLMIMVSPIFVITETLHVGDPMQENGESSTVAYDEAGREVVHFTFVTGLASEGQD